MDDLAAADDRPRRRPGHITPTEQARLLDLSNDAIIVRDVDNRIIYWNHGATELYGWTHDEAIGQDLHTLLRTEFELPLDQLIIRLHQHDRMEGEVVQVRRDGHRRTLWCRWALDRDAEGQPGAILTTYNDITARKEADTRLRASEASLRALISQTTTGIAGADLHGTLTLVNPTFCTMLGYDESELVGTTIWALTHADDQADTRRLFEHLKTTGTSFDLEKRLLRKDQSILWAHVSVAAIRTPADQPYATVAVILDITEQKQAEAAVREREAWFRLMADAVPQIVWLTDAEGRVEFFNAQWTRYTGTAYEPTTAAEVAASFVHPDDAAMTLEAFTNARQTGSPFAVEHRIRSAAGTYRWFLVRAEPYRDPQTGVITRWFGASIDIHDRKRAETAVRESEVRFRAVANLVPDLLWSTDPHGQSAWYNQRWYDYTGQTVEDTRGAGWLDVIHPADRESSRRTVQRALETGEPVRVEYRMRGADESYRWFLVRTRPMHDDEGRIVRWYDAATDIHQERMALEQVEAALTIREQFLSIASHELRTPLTALMGFVYLLPKVVTQSPGTVHQVTERITQQAQRLNTLIDQLLDVSRLQRGQFVIERHVVDLTPLVTQVVEAFRATQPTDTRHPIDVHRPDAPVLVLGDALRLEQVIHNLLSNAVKYSPRGGAVQVRVGHTATDAIASVADQGLGIPEADQARLFEAFYRAQNVGQTSSGFGLGLHIVSEIMQRHGGRIEVESTEGQGSTFRVLLPLHTSMS